MPHNYSILNMLNLKDENITFGEGFCFQELIKGVNAKVFYGSLSYTPKACYSCGHVFDENIIKHGFKASTIKIPSVSGFSTYLKLKKQRYLCKHCGGTFTLKTSIVNKNAFISNNTKLAVALSAKEKISEKDIGKLHNVSHSTVSRVINSFYLHYKPNYKYLPKNLSFDEFKSVKAAAGAMSFIFCESSTGEIVDIVEDRRLHVLTNYFYRYSIGARKSVETVVIDMYSPYISLIKKVFPNAQIIIDKFHVMQLLSRSLNKTRIRLMNKDKKNYNKLKRYWKLLLKCETKINHVDYHYHRCFKGIMREKGIIDYLLDLDPELEASYRLYHDIRYLIRNDDAEGLKELLAKPSPYISDYMKTSVKTLNKYLKYVENMMHYGYTNGVLEGINNKIKVIKRIAFGYKSFFHFRNRILITQNLIQLKTA